MMKFNAQANVNFVLLSSLAAGLISAPVSFARSFDEIVDASSAQSIVLLVRGADDKVECFEQSNPDKLLIRSRFGSPASVDLTRVLRRIGSMQVECQVFDNQLGKCYAYDIDILVDGVSRVRGRKGKFSCCSHECSAEVDNKNDPVRRLSFLINR